MQSVLCGSLVKWVNSLGSSASRNTLPLSVRVGVAAPTAVHEPGSSLRTCRKRPLEDMRPIRVDALRESLMLLVSIVGTIVLNVFLRR